MQYSPSTHLRKPHGEPEIKFCVGVLVVSRELLVQTYQEIGAYSAHFGADPGSGERQLRVKYSCALWIGRRK